MPFGPRNQVASSRGFGQRGSSTILVADDAPAVLAYVAEVLQTHGYHVLEAVDGVEALKVAAEHSGPIDLLVTDIEMPRLNGLELHRRLRHQRPETRTLFMSGVSDTVLEPEAAFLSKPFVARALMRKVSQVLQASCSGRQA
jgi:two-component system, cell cycle sensor histidine kinase and response regulator CckA